MLVFFDPQRAWGCPHGACPTHGFGAHMKKKGHTEPRRVSGVWKDMWAACRYIKCTKCENAKQKLVTKLGKSESERATAGLKAKVASARTRYRGDDPRMHESTHVK